MVTLSDANIALPPAVTTFAGKMHKPGFADGDSGEAQFRNPTDVAVSQMHNSKWGITVYVLDSGNNAIRQIKVESGKKWVVTTLVGGPSSSHFHSPLAMTFLAPCDNACASESVTNNHQMLLVMDTQSHTMRMVSIGFKTVVILAGAADKPGSADGSGQTARFKFPR
jgi:hypothetical protein